MNNFFSAGFIYGLLNEATRPKSFESWAAQLSVYSPGKVTEEEGGLVLDREAAEFEIGAYNWAGTEAFKAAMAALDGLEVITDADLAYMQETADAIDAALQQDAALWEAEDSDVIPFDGPVAAAEPARGLHPAGVTATAKPHAAALYGEVVSFDLEKDLPRMDRVGIEWVLQQARSFDLGAVAVGVLRHYGCSIPVLVCGPEEAVGAELRLQRASDLVLAVEAELKRLAAWEEAIEAAR